MKKLYLIFGMIFGFILIKSGVSNYDVIQEMFLFKSFHLYGVLGVAVVSYFLIVQTLKKLNFKPLLDSNKKVDYSVAEVDNRHVRGGLMAGVGWAITGACPGPALAQIGFGTLSGIFTATGIFIGVYVFINQNNSSVSSNSKGEC